MSHPLDLETVTRALLTAGEAEARRVRPRTESIRRFSKRHLAVVAAQYPEAIERPRTFGECQTEGFGDWVPCPFVGCKHHLYLDVTERNGNIKFNKPDREPGEIGETCGLRVAGRGGITLEEIGALLNLTRERVRQIEDLALAKLGGHPTVSAWGPEGTEGSSSGEPVSWVKLRGGAV